VRTEGYGPARPSSAIRSARLERGQAEVPRLAIVTRSLALDPTTSLFTDAVERPLVITCADAPADRHRALAEVAELVVAGESAVDLPAAMAALAELGVRTVCCEGGPQLNGDLLAADLIDEWALTLSPLLVGGGPDRAITGAPTDARELHLDWLCEGDGLLLTRWLRDR
jgi:riboflavin biosynthesis pyrimidine reductase